jgi:hypothetical protein
MGASWAAAGAVIIGINEIPVDSTAEASTAAVNRFAMGFL